MKSIGEALIEMAQDMPRIKKGYADGAYDKGYCYQKLQDLGAELIVPPQRGAVLHDLKKEPWMKQRNDAIRAIAGLGNDEEARKIWKKLTGYHQRSLAETAVYRYKTVFGGNLMAREIRRQKAEIYTKSLAMNKITKLGMPKGKWTD